MKHQFSQVERDLDLQEIPKPIHIFKKRAPKKKLVVVKAKMKKVKKLKRFGWMVKYYTSLF
jgi:hypothetical protein